MQYSIIFCSFRSYCGVPEYSSVVIASAIIESSKKRSWYRENIIGTILVDLPQTMVNEVTINYNVQSEGTVTIAVYNIAGELIKTLTNEYKNAGEHTVKWYANDANNNEVAEGIYFICLTSKDFTKTSKITLIR